jgi:methylated-DNA-[protein]-cysteine S-methyltransferase
MVIVSDGSAITAIEHEKVVGKPSDISTDQLTSQAARQLGEYFSGKRRKFDIPLNPSGTEFQQAVWEALLSIPYGETRSYKQVAEMVGNPKGSRAVGMANNKNPISIIIPCHRVIGSNGALIGYAGGLDMKKGLLELEGAFK